MIILQYLHIVETRGVNLSLSSKGRTQHFKGATNGGSDKYYKLKKYMIELKLILKLFIFTVLCSSFSRILNVCSNSV